MDTPLEDCRKEELRKRSIGFSSLIQKHPPNPDLCIEFEISLFALHYACIKKWPTFLWMTPKYLNN